MESAAPRENTWATSHSDEPMPFINLHNTSVRLRDTARRRRLGEKNWCRRRFCNMRRTLQEKTHRIMCDCNNCHTLTGWVSYSNRHCLFAALPLKLLWYGTVEGNITWPINPDWNQNIRVSPGICLVKVQEKLNWKNCQSIRTFPCQIDQVAAVGLPMASIVKTTVPLCIKPVVLEIVEKPWERANSSQKPRSSCLPSWK